MLDADLNYKSLNSLEKVPEFKKISTQPHKTGVI